MSASMLLKVRFREKANASLWPIAAIFDSPLQNQSCRLRSMDKVEGDGENLKIRRSVVSATSHGQNKPIWRLHGLMGKC